MEMNIVVKLLDALRGYRLLFYHLDDHRIDTYAVYNRMRVPLSKLLLSPQGDFRVLLGSFSEDEIREAVRDTISYQSRALDYKYSKLMERWDRSESTLFKDSIDRSFNGFTRNPKTNRMIKVGSQRYKDQFAESKKKRGRPHKCIWGGDPLAYAGSMFKDVDSMDREFVDKYLDKVSFRCIRLIYDDGRTDKLFVGTHRAFLKNVPTKGLFKYGIADICIGKDVKVNLPISGLVMNPETHRTNSMKLLRHVTSTMYD